MAKRQPAKRVSIVSLRMVRESSILYDQRNISSPGDAAGLLNEFLEEGDREQFIVLCLNTKNNPTAIATVSIGSLNSSIIHPREVFKIAMLANSASVIISHNHPSGDPEPSREDIAVTRRLVEAGEILGIHVIDHVVVGRDKKYISFRERGLMDSENK